MKRLIAICGLDCEKCDAYIATKNDDQELREKTARLWSAEMRTSFSVSPSPSKAAFLFWVRVLSVWLRETLLGPRWFVSAPAPCPHQGATELTPV